MPIDSAPLSEPLEGIATGFTRGVPGLHTRRRWLRHVHQHVQGVGAPWDASLWLDQIQSRAHPSTQHEERRKSMRSMRYEARGNVVYDTEEDTVVESCNVGTPAQQAFCARVNARKANERDQEWRDFDSMMRGNRSVCG